MEKVIFWFLSKINLSPKLIDLLKKIRLHTFLRFNDQNVGKRVGFERRIKNFSKFILKNKTTGGYFSDDGSFYVKSPDDIFMFYNTANSFTKGTGQDNLFFIENYITIETEKILFNLIDEKSIYFDIGANNGYYFTLKVGKRFPSARIYAFEPNEGISYHLNKNISFNGLRNITFVPQAITNFVGISEMTDDRGAGNHLLNDSNEPAFKVSKVKCNTLDGFVNENNINCIDIIKADIEGEEFNLLIGAKSVLNNFRPYCIFELDEKLLNRKHASIQKIIKYLNDINYNCFHIKNTSDAFLFPAEKKEFITSEIWNYLEQYPLL